MHIGKSILRRTTISCLTVFGLLAILVLPAFAASSKTTTGTLYGTGDYIETDAYINYITPVIGSTFNFQTSSWLWGTRPNNADWIQDTVVVSVNGLAVTIGNTGGSVSASSNTATYQCTFYNNWYCGNQGSNLIANGFLLDIQAQDTTTVHTYSWSAQKFYNGATATQVW